jgi:hypothetical protein
VLVDGEVAREEVDADGGLGGKSSTFVEESN